MLSVPTDANLMDAALTASPARRRTALLERSVNTPEPRFAGPTKPSPARMPLGWSPLASALRSHAELGQESEQENGPDPRAELRREWSSDSPQVAKDHSNSPPLMTFSPPSSESLNQDGVSAHPRMESESSIGGEADEDQHPPDDVISSLGNAEGAKFSSSLAEGEQVETEQLPQESQSPIKPIDPHVPTSSLKRAEQHEAMVLLQEWCASSEVSDGPLPVSSPTSSEHWEEELLLQSAGEAPIGADAIGIMFPSGSEKSEIDSTPISPGGLTETIQPAPTTPPVSCRAEATISMDCEVSPMRDEVGEESVSHLEPASPCAAEETDSEMHNGISLDDDNEVLRELVSKLVNAQEDASAWQAEHDRILNEGRALYISYATKCERVKTLRAELEQTRSAHNLERERLQAEIKALREAVEKQSNEARKENAQIAKIVHSAMEATAGMSVESLMHKLEAVTISNELLRAEIARQQATAKQDALAAEVHVNKLKQEHANELASYKASEASMRNQIEAERVQIAQLNEQLVQQQSHIQTLLQEADAARAEAESLVDYKAAAEKDREAREAAFCERDAALQAAAIAISKQDTLVAQVAKLETDLRILYHQQKDESQIASRRYEGVTARCTALSARCAKQHRVIEEMGLWIEDFHELSDLCEQNQSTLRDLSTQLVGLWSHPVDGNAVVASQKELDTLLQTLNELQIERDDLRQQLDDSEKASAETADIDAKVASASVVSTIVSEMIGKIEMDAAVAAAKAEAVADAEERRRMDAQHYASEHEQIARLKEELQRMSLYARELSDLQNRAGESSILTQHEYERLIRQVADGEDELAQAQKMIAQLAFSTAEMIQQVQAQRFDSEAAAEHARQEADHHATLVKASQEREANLLGAVEKLKGELLAQTRASEVDKQAVIQEWSVICTKLSDEIAQLQESARLQQCHAEELRRSHDEALRALDGAKLAEEEARRIASEEITRAANEQHRARTAEEDAREARQAERLALNESAANQEVARIANHKRSEAEHSLSLTRARLQGQAEVESALRTQLTSKAAELRDALSSLQHAREELSQIVRQSALSESYLRQVYTSTFSAELRDVDDMLDQAMSDVVDGKSTIDQLRAQLQRALQSSSLGLSSSHISLQSKMASPDHWSSISCTSPSKLPQPPPRPSPSPEHARKRESVHQRISLGGGRLPSSRVSMGSALQRPPGWSIASSYAPTADEASHPQEDALAATKRRLAERSGRQSDASSFAPMSIIGRTRSQSAAMKLSR